jgi:predicted DNA-binding protein
MSQILIQLPAEMLKALDRIAPGRSRKRSRFVQLAIQKALMEVQDLETCEAYRRVPDDEDEGFDPRVWDEWRPRASAGRPGARPKRTRRKR